MKLGISKLSAHSILIVINMLVAKRQTYIKGTGHYIGNYLHQNLFGTEQWRAVDSIKNCEKRLPLK